MRISWLSADEIRIAREALTEGGRGYDDSFVLGAFVPPAVPEGRGVLDWEHITEHVARAERVSSVVRLAGLDGARTRFGGSDVAIEAATLAAAAHEGEQLELDEVIGVLRRPIDPYVFYAPFLELLMSLGAGEMGRAVGAYEQFVDAYATGLADSLHGAARVGAVRDGLADVYVSAGRIADAEALFERRHEEDQNDVAVALSASRAFLAAGAVSHAVRWLGVAAARATGLGRTAQAAKLRQTQEAVAKRLGEPN
jgi:hypothetical protein